MEESFEFVRRNIASSTNQFQLDCCYTLMTLFKVKYEGSEGFKELHHRLLSGILSKETFLNPDA